MRRDVGDTWELRSGSCLDAWDGLASLADLSVDVTITDPPYEAEAHTKGKRQTRAVDKGEGRGKAYGRLVEEEFAFDAITEITRTMVASEIARVSRKAAAVFCQIEAVHLWRAALECHGMIYRRTIPWVKPDAMPSMHGKWPGQAFESLVLVAREGVEFPVGGKARYYQETRERGDARAHPTAKPIRLMRKIVADLTDEGDLVLDPFAGSGSTAVACKAEHRRSLSWEMLDGSVPVEVPVKDENGKQIKIDGEPVTKIEYPDYYGEALRRIRGQARRRNPKQGVLDL